MLVYKKIWLNVCKSSGGKVLRVLYCFSVLYNVGLFFREDCLFDKDNFL